MSASGEATQNALQAVAQGTRWTYSLLWQLCPHQGALVWAEGHYNGAIKTRKTVQPGGDDDDDEDGGGEEEVAPAGASGGGKAARRRSRQLRELYDSLAREAAAADGGGGGGAGGAPAARRPCAALAPEDLAETEWFYLMCASYCFPPGIGLPGKAFATRGHVWLTGANQVDSKVFSRAILAKSAGIQTVACIPVADGVLEIGTTEKVEEDVGLVQYARRVFMDQRGISMVPTLSGHSTSNSNPMTHIDDDDSPLQIKMVNYDITGSGGYRNVLHQPPQNNLNKRGGGAEIDVVDDDDDQLDMECCASDLEPNNNNNNNGGGGSCRHAAAPLMNFGGSSAHAEATTPSNNNAAGSCELMRVVDASDRARYGGCPSYVDEEIMDTQMVRQNANTTAQTTQWDLLYENLCNAYLDPAGAAPGPPAGCHLRPGLVGWRRAARRAARKGERNAWEEQQHR